MPKLLMWSEWVTHYQERLPGNPYIYYYTVEYSYNGIPCKRIVQEVAGTLKEGNVLALRIKPSTLRECVHGGCGGANR